MCNDRSEIMFCNRLLVPVLILILVGLQATVKHIKADYRKLENLDWSGYWRHIFKYE